ncbi:MAG: hypothetical protein HY420_01165, partial [Candidatus Kerfeldbacteria bacterium]|nr:hypothetical protein [Candidatus Kerfeldbacteria bacterium]
MNDRQMHLARRLFEVGAVKFGAFKLKMHETNPDAPLSPIYFNLRTSDNPKPGPLGPEELDMISGALAQYITDHEPSHQVTFDGLSPVPNAGDPLVEAICRKLPGGLVPVVKLRKEGAGDSRKVTGVADSGGLPPGGITLVVDDLITGADSKLEAIEALKKAGYSVEDVLVLIDRQQGGREQLERRGYRLHTVFTLTALLDYYTGAALIDASKRAEVLAYIGANQVTV